MSAVLFFLAAIGAIAGALGVVMLRNPFYNVLALVGHLLALAALFLLLNSQFVAAAQVVVYAGAVMVLYVFVVAYVGDHDEPVDMLGGSGLRAVAVLACGALFVELCLAVLGSGLSAINSRGAHIDPSFGAPAAIGQALLTKFLFPFEGASLLLLVAAIGAVILARRRRGIEGAEGSGVGREIAVRRPAYSGTMFEAGGGAMEAAEAAAGATTDAPVPAEHERADERDFRGGW